VGATPTRQLVVKRSIGLEAEPIVGPGEVVIELSHGNVPIAALEIRLLLEAMTTSLRFSAGAGCSVLLTVSDARVANKALVTSHDSGVVAFHVGINQAEYLEATLLRAYRDEAAEVNHLHVEGLLDSNAMDLTVLFERSLPSMSAEEAEKRLS